MKTAVRFGVFETNSSSTHTLSLVSKTDYEADKQKEKPKYRKYDVVATKYDKLFMACGCAYELFVTEERIADYAAWGDEEAIERKQEFDDVKRVVENGRYEMPNLDDFDSDETQASLDKWCNDIVCLCEQSNVYYEVAMRLIVEVYCELTGESYNKIYNRTDKKNYSGRACHMKFFEEGALEDPDMDYDIIMELFVGDVDEVKDNLRRYFDDNNVLLYREFYAGVGWDDDDDE